MSGYTKRPSELRDVDMMSAIERVCFTVPWSRESIEQTVKSDAAYCVSVLCGDDVVGYGFSVTVADESEILNLAVSPEHRRRGIGRLILDEMLKGAASSGAKTAYLEVRESNKAASALYESEGFTVVGRRKNYYKLPTEDAVIMAKVLVGGADNDNSRN